MYLFFLTSLYFIIESISTCFSFTTCKCIENPFRLKKNDNFKIYEAFQSIVLKKGVEMPLKIFYILGKYKIYISSTKDICILWTIMLVFCSHFLQFYSTSRTIWHKALIYSVYTYYYIIHKYI